MFETKHRQGQGKGDLWRKRERGQKEEERKAREAAEASKAPPSSRGKKNIYKEGYRDRSGGEGGEAGGSHRRAESPSPTSCGSK